MEGTGEMGTEPVLGVIALSTTMRVCPPHTAVRESVKNVWQSVEARNGAPALQGWMSLP